MDLMSRHSSGGFLNFAYHDSETLESDKRLVQIEWHNIIIVKSL